MRSEAKFGQITERKWNLEQENTTPLSFSYNTATMLITGCIVEIDFNSILWALSGLLILAVTLQK